MMNEKLKELVEQSGGYYLPPNTVLNKPEHVFLEDEQIKRFAELIVKECVNIAETYDLLLDEDDRECCICRKVAWRIADNINSKFGIE